MLMITHRTTRDPTAGRYQLHVGQVENADEISLVTASGHHSTRKAIIVLPGGFQISHEDARAAANERRAAKKFADTSDNSDSTDCRLIFASSLFPSYGLPKGVP